MAIQDVFGRKSIFSVVRDDSHRHVKLVTSDNTRPARRMW